MAELAINLGFRTQIATKGGEGIISEKYIYHRDGTFETIPLQNRMGCTVYRDRENALNYGTGLAFFRLKLSTQQTSKLFDLDGRPVTIVEDKTDSNCTLISTGMSVIKFYNGAFKIFKQMPEGKADNAIWGLIQTGKDSFLLTTEKGLKWYDWAHNRIFYSVLDSFSINSVYAESASRIWISTYGNGFFLYSKGKLYRLPCGNFTALRSVHFFADDGRGSFWLPTNNGLYKVRKDALLDYASGKSKEVYYYSFTTRNGLRSNEFNGRGMPYYVWLKDSMLSLLSIKGPVWFYPNNIPIDYPDKHIYVDQVKVNDSAISYPANGQISLLPDFENITLTVSSPYFGNKENLQLRYKIEGISTDWQPVAANGKIQLNRVPSGHYRLIISKLTGRKINQYESLILSIIVKPWFYNTWWFYAILAILMIGCIYLIIKLRTRLLIRRNQKLRHIIASQTEDLSKTVNLLSKSEKELHESNLLKDNIITMVLHDLRSPIRFLHFVSKKTAINYSALDYEEVQQRLVEINTSAAALDDFTQQFFTWAISQRQNFSIKKTLVDLQVLFEEIAALYEDLVKINNNRLQVLASDHYVNTDSNILSVIIRNLLDNASKNTQNGTISLYAARTPSDIVITVADTGSGLMDDQLQAFNNMSSDQGHTGYGSRLILDLLKKIDGKLEIDTQPGVGTRFNILLKDVSDSLPGKSDPDTA